MHIDWLLIDVVFIVAVMIGFGLIPVIQVKYSSRYLFRLEKKLGPEYWGNLYAGSTDSSVEPCISVHPPAREAQSNYGRQA